MASWLHRLIYGNPQQASPAEQANAATLPRQIQGAQDAAQTYTTRDAAFDPDQAFRTSATGAQNEFSRSLALTLRNNRDLLGGTGRFNSGYFTEDQGEIVKDLGSRFQDQLAGRALETAGMRQRQIEGNREYSMFQQQDTNDLVSGQLDREQAERNARRQFRSALLGSAAHVAGAAVGARGGGGGGG